MALSTPRTATAWGFLLPALVLIGLSVLIPAAMALVMSVSQAGLDVSEPLRFVGLANVRRLLADPMFSGSPAPPFSTWWGSFPRS
jgi:putative chitobiose transport system permease protein